MHHLLKSENEYGFHMVYLYCLKMVYDFHSWSGTGKFGVMSSPLHINFNQHLFLKVSVYLLRE